MDSVARVSGKGFALAIPVAAFLKHAADWQSAQFMTTIFLNFLTFTPQTLSIFRPDKRRAVLKACCDLLILNVLIATNHPLAIAAKMTKTGPYWVRVLLFSIP